MSKKNTGKKQSKKNKSKVLNDHKKIGSKYFPPLMAYPKLQPISWAYDMLPEILWLALLRDKYGYKKSIQYAMQLSTILNTVVDEQRKCGFYMASDFNRINQDEYDVINSKIDAELREAINFNIGSISKYYPEFPMRWLVSKKWMNENSVGLECLEEIKNTIRLCTDKSSKPAMECQVLAFVLEGQSGKLKVHSDIVHDLNLISEYPASDASRRMAAHVRAAMNALLMHRDQSKTWPNYFWKHSYSISSCEYNHQYLDLNKKANLIDNIEEDNTNEFNSIIDNIHKFGKQFAEDAAMEIHNLWNSINIDLANPAKTNVIAGLLSRNLQFVCDIVCNLDYLIMPLSAIIMRCMIETQIRLTWLIRCAKDQDYKDFIEYGLGQEKLHLEHLKRISAKNRPDREEILKDIEFREKWINSQRFTFMLPVDIGGGNQGKDLRIMAEEANILELHRLAYSPLSSYIHGHWNTIEHLNLTPCLNPLHAQHWLPALPKRPISFLIINDALNCYSECFEIVSEALTNNKVESKSSMKYLEQMKEALNSDLE